MGNIMTIVEKTGEHHRSHIIIHAGTWYIAEFENRDQLDFFAQTVGFTYEIVESRKHPFYGKYEEYRLSREIDGGSCGGFWNLSELPDGAKPIKALSNGSIVTCYYTNDGQTIRFYRPNPNAKEVYKPLDLQNHIAHKRIYGVY